MGAPKQEILAGGQAVLEGVMMKLPRSWAVTVRRANGEFVSRSGVHVPWTERWPILKLPVLRGVATLFSMMGLGMRALFFSSDVMAQDLQEQEEREKAEADAEADAMTVLGAAALLASDADDAASDADDAAGDGDSGPSDGPSTSGGGAVLTLLMSQLAVLQAVADGPDGTEPDDQSDGDSGGDAGDEPNTPAPDASGTLPDGGGMSKWEIALSAALALGTFLLLFKALPLGTAWLAAKAWPALGAPVAESVISGIALVVVFISYLMLMSLIPDIRRVFQYHGAEHKVVYVHEGGEERTVENAQQKSTLHPRCGTSFLFFVVLTSIVVWSLFPLDAGFLPKLGLRLALFPLIVGLSFELIRFTARHRESLILRALMAPGLWSQRITTKPPDDGMVEVSLNSLALAEGVADGGQAPGH